MKQLLTPVELERMITRFGDQSFAESLIVYTKYEREKIYAAENIPSIMRVKIEVECNKILEDNPELEQIQGPYGTSMLKMGEGITLLEAMMIQDLTGASIFTNSEQCRYRLERFAISKDPKQQIIATALSDLELSFLNDVPAELSCRLRADGAFKRFRSFLNQNINNTSGTMGFLETTKDSKQAKEFIEIEYEAYKKEWREIDQKLLSKYMLQTTLGGVAIVQGSINFQQALGGLLATQSGFLLHHVFSKRAKSRHPLNMFISIDV